MCAVYQINPVCDQRQCSAETFPQPHTCVRAQQTCGLSGWRSSSCWPPVAWRAAEAASGPAPASQPCVAAQEWSDSCRHRGLYGHETPPCLSPDTANAGVSVSTTQQDHNSCRGLAAQHSSPTVKKTKQRHDLLNCGITHSMWCGKTWVKGDDVGLLCLLVISVFSLHVIFLLLFLIVCQGTKT